MMYDLKMATAAEAPPLATLWASTFTEAYCDVHTPENIKAYCVYNFSAKKALNTLSDSDVICVIASKNAKPVGFYILKNTACPYPLSGASSELKQIYIRSSEYGQGLGSQLFRHAMDTLMGDDIEWIWLAVSDINHPALSFYKRLGFSAVGTGPTFVVGTDRLPSTILTKQLINYVQTSK